MTDRTLSVLLGPPGTGKTTTLLGIMRTERDRNQVAPSEMAFLTFTKDARRVAVTEVGRGFGYGPKELPYFGTLHAMCFRMLNMSRELLIRNSSDLVDFGRRYRFEFSPPTQTRVDFDGDFPVQFGSERGDYLLQIDHWIRHRKLELTPRMVHRLFPDADFREAELFCAAYAKYKRTEGLRDFTDLLQDAEGELPVKVVFVDEAQDLSDLQWDTLFRIIRPAERIYIAGDDDQAIFTWAGASPQRFMQLAAEARATNTRRVLRHSHRLPKVVHSFATGVSAEIKTREEKAFNPKDYEGHLYRVEEVDDLELSHGDPWLLLVRNHYLGLPIVDRLRDLGIPYSVTGMSSIPADVAKAIESWEVLKSGRALYYTDVCAMYDRLTPGAGIADKLDRKRVREIDPERLYSAADLSDRGLLSVDQPWEAVVSGCSLYEMAYLSKVRRSCGSLYAQPTVHVKTIHAAKGGESENVALFGGASRKVLDSAETDRDSELRVLYVGATRSLNTLTLVGDSEVLGAKWRR